MKSLSLVFSVLFVLHFACVLAQKGVVVPVAGGSLVGLFVEGQQSFRVSVTYDRQAGKPRCCVLCLRVCLLFTPCCSSLERDLQNPIKTPFLSYESHADFKITRDGDWTGVATAFGEV